MSDIFISYAREDESRAARLADVLRDAGYSVWWDRKIPPGRSFEDVIENALNTATCVLVLWSRSSVGSRWVRNEAAAALERDCLIPVSLDDVTAPLAFRDIQAVQLAGWRGGIRHPQFQLLLETLRERIPVPRAHRSQGVSGDAPYTQATDRPRVRWSERIRRALTVSDKVLQRLIVAEIVSLWLLIAVAVATDGFIDFASTAWEVGMILVFILLALTVASIVSLAILSAARLHWRGFIVALSPLLCALAGILLGWALPRDANDILNILFIVFTPPIVTRIGFVAWLELRGSVYPSGISTASASNVAHGSSRVDY